MSIKHIDINDWRHCFPHEHVRAEQEVAINYVLEQFINNDKRTVIVEAPPGIGKSAIAVTIAEYLNSMNNVGDVSSDENDPHGAYFLTTQKILQEQYMNDFGPPKGSMMNIKSASNYACTFVKDQSCGESRRIINALGKRLEGTDFVKHCRSQCAYKIAKADFISASMGITNFSYFLAETMYAGKLLPRQLLVIDECHTIEDQLGKFIEVTFSERFARETLKLKVPKFVDDDALIKWIGTKYRGAVAKKKTELERAIDSAYASGTSFCTEFANQYEMLDKHICKVNRFLSTYDKNNWVLNLIPTPPGTKFRRKWEFKPVDVSPFSHESLFKFGNRALLMSATIIDEETFCKNIGIDRATAAFISIPSPFKKENRQIHYISAGSMSRKNIDATLPVMTQTIKMLLEHHANEKGIIHCVSHKIAQFIAASLNDDRILTHTSSDRDLVLLQHTTSQKPTVLLTPSMTEGIDLVDELSRFQILCKVPFPYLGDSVVKLRMKANKKWYAYQTTKSIIQAMGRSIRNQDDFATSYILDSDWQRFYRDNQGMFPSDFKDLIV